MDSNTPLDYAELQLTPRRIRCELLVSADGVTEKLASGFCKPFVSHLRVAEVQVARGSQAIRLEQHPNVSNRTGRTWFTKGTLERFVRFVSGPEVIERVKSIQDELAQLEQVRSALASTFPQADGRFRSIERTHSSRGADQGRDGMLMMSRWDSTDADDAEPDASKLELLRAMDVRLAALRQEQNMAFTRAAAAGFDSDNIGDLMSFAENFGAHRLGDACVQFISLLKKKAGVNEKHEEMDCPYAKTSSSGSETSLGSDTRSRTTNAQRNRGTAEKLQMNYTSPTMFMSQDSIQSGITTKVNKEFACQTYQDERLTEDGMAVFSAREEFCAGRMPENGSAVSQKSSSLISHSSQEHNSQDQKSESVAKGGVFSCLQQKAHIEARKLGGDSGGSAHPTFKGISDEPELASQVHASGDEGHTQFQSHEVKHLPARSHFPDRGLSLAAKTAQIGSPRLWHSSSMPTQVVNLNHPQDGANKEESFKKPEDVEGSKAKDDKEEELVSTSFRRLSVQAAISLFEGKKQNSTEPPVKRFVKQEGRRGSMDSCNSPTFEKAVLKRWSGINLPSLGENCEQEKRTVLDTAEARKCEDHDFTNDKDEANNDARKDSKFAHDKHIHPVVEENETEKHKTSLSSVVANLIYTQKREQTSPSPSSELVVTSNNLLNGPSGDLQNQFDVDLKKSLTRELQDSDAVGARISLKSEVESRNVATSSMMKPLKDLLSAPKSDSQSIVESKLSDKKVAHDQEQKGNGSGNFGPTLHTTVANGPKLSTKASMEQNDARQRNIAHSKQEVGSLRESDIVKFKEVVDDSDQTDSKSDLRNFKGERQQDLAKEFSPDVWNTPADSHMQALIKMADDQYHDPMNLSSEESSSQLRGRFYDQYERLRDARLRGAPPAKRAEREAKLKSMQETLEKRNAEMKAKALVGPKKNIRMAQTQSGFQKSQVRKAGLTLAQKEQEEQGVEEEGTDQEDSFSQVQDQLCVYSNPASPASTPHSLNQASSLKQQTVKKAATNPMKSATAPRTSTRSAAVSSPRSNLKSSVGPPIKRKPPTTSQSSTVDSSIMKPAANLKESKKETKKPSSGRMVASAKVHPKISGNLQTASDFVSPADDGNVMPNDDDLSATPDEEEMNLRSSLLNTNCTTVPEIETPSVQVLDVMVLESLEFQQEGVTESLINGAVRQSAMNVSQEGKLFLHKGQGIGPGDGPGSMKQKVCNSGDASKTSDGGSSADSVVTWEFADSENLRRGTFLTKSHATDQFGPSADRELSVASNVLVMDVSNNYVSPSADKGQPDNIELETLACLAADASDHVNACRGVFCSDDLHEEKHLGPLAVDSVSAARDLFPAMSIQKQNDLIASASLSQLLTEGNIGSLQSNATLTTPSASIRVASLPHEHATSPFSPADASLVNSSMPQHGAVSGHFSPPATMALDSPLGSPASWISTRSQYASEVDLVRSRRQLNGPQKPAFVMTHVPKEPAKGFKRLLHFGRKSRASEMATTDYVSASTPSEGDDDAEETKDLGSQFCDGLLRKTRMQEKGLEFGNSGDNYSYQDQGAVQFLPSSIPAPPANFKLRDDHLSGGTLLKAPRSFFSLSTFRSRGTEGKSR